MTLPRCPKCGSYGTDPCVSTAHTVLYGHPHKERLALTQPRLQAARRKPEADR